MNPKTRVKLRFGPYRTPAFRYGDVVFCERCGEVTLCGLSSGRIPWPMCRRGKAKAIALVGGLVDAVRRESALAVQYWWGVGGDTIWKWRQALGVGRQTEGTRALQSDYANEPRMDVIRAKAWAKARDPERRAKISAAKRGKPLPPQVHAACAKANRGRRPSNETRRKMSETHKRLGTRPPHGRVWTPEEDELLCSLSPCEMANQTGRSMASVWQRRRALKLPDGRHSNGRVPRLGPWTAEEDVLLASLPAREAAARTGRSLHIVYRRRKQLRRQNVKLADGRQNNGRVPQSRRVK